MGNLTREELETAVRNHFAPSSDFVPDVAVSELTRERDGAYYGELFLSFPRGRPDVSVEHLRDALARIKDGFARGEILAGQVTEAELVEGVEGAFNEGPDIVTLPVRVKLKTSD